MIGETHLARPLEPPRFAEAVAIFIAMPSAQTLSKCGPSRKEEN